MESRTSRIHADGDGVARLQEPGHQHTSTFFLGVAAALVLYLMALVQPNAAANMKPLFEFEWTVEVSLLVFLINFPINLLAYSALLLVLCSVWGRKLGEFPKEPMAFLARVALVVLLVTTLGVVIDFLFLYSYETRYVFRYDLMKWLAASAAVGLSVYALSLLFLKMNIVLGTIPALGMMGLNLASWWFASELLETSWTLCIFGPSVMAGALAAIPLAYLEKWHKRAFAKERAESA